MLEHGGLRLNIRATNLMNMIYVVGVYFTWIKLFLSVVSMSRVCVMYWMQDMPFQFLTADDEEPYLGQEPQTYIDRIKVYWRKLVAVSSILPYHLEAFSLSCELNNYIPFIQSCSTRRAGLDLLHILS